MILGLKPSRSLVPDGYVWNHTKSGVYSVKTDYDLLRSTKLSLTQEGVTEPSITRLQSHVWKLKVPSKMKHFLWQAISGCVATAERLMYRHLGTDRSCPRCASPVESINHLLFVCPSGLGFIGLFVPSGLLPEYIHISKHELPVLEEKGGGFAETTIRYLPMDLLVHLEGEERQTF